jgi:hypothetical protein
MSSPGGRHPLRCSCGTVRGYVDCGKNTANRGVCYCKDCQAFARFLGNAGDILDDMNGTEVVATLPKYVSFTAGREALACMSLTPNGLLRWYASCCNTPIGNTPRDFKFSYVGLVHTCLKDPSISLESSFGPVRMRVNTKSAKGKPQSTPISTLGAILGFMKMLIGARITGGYRNTPFFDVESGASVAAPKVLSRAERDRLRNPT